VYTSPTIQPAATCLTVYTSPTIQPAATCLTVYTPPTIQPAATCLTVYTPPTIQPAATCLTYSLMAAGIAISLHAKKQEEADVLKQLPLGQARGCRAGILNGGQWLLSCL
jgi:hypothetical protein